MKQDERDLLGAVFAKNRSRPMEMAQKIGMDASRARFLLRKWTKKEWWNRDVSIEHGWLTSKGIDAAILESGRYDPTPPATHPH